VLDVLLNPLLIFGWGRFRAWDSRLRDRHFDRAGASFAALVMRLYRIDHFLCIRRGELRLFVVNWPLVRVLVTRGIPMGCKCSSFPRA